MKFCSVFLAPRPEDLPRVIDSKRRALDFIKKTCLGTQC
jgi:hypothetical protein